MANGLEDFGSFFNIFFFLLIVGLIIIPQIRYRWLTSARKNQMMRMGTERSSNVISMIHRQESIGLFGIPFYRFINMEDSEQVLRAIRMTPDEKPIDLIMHTPGGLVLAASQIAQAKELGLNVNNQIPGEVYTLMGYYPQPMFQRQVEFVPSPQRRKEDRQNTFS